ncbi:MAG TPA: hypothetical protein VKT80_00030, partial [Chloroflexota bacterium]|nr:hypothetical protein [Chloroflexota bacterium]
MPSAYTVTNTANSGAGSLPAAFGSGANVIDFNIPTSDPGYNATTGTFTLSLPGTITLNSPFVIDGTSQPGYTGQPLIELNGTNAGAGADGIDVTGGNTTIEGLAINRYSGTGIFIGTLGGDTIKADYLGTDPTGTVALANNIGLYIGSGNNVIGGTAAGSANLISGNTVDGIQIGAGGTLNTIVGNVIG